MPTKAVPYLIGAAMLFAGCASEPTPTTTIDFHKEVAPIFKARCLNCHGLHQQQGGLRLDDKAFAFQGGLSGKKLIGTPPEESELLRRVTSDDLAVVMPKEGGRLNEQEFNVLRRWVAARAPWPDKIPPSGRDEFLARYGKDFWKRLSVFGGEPKLFLLLAFAILVGVGERIRRVLANSERWSHGLRRRLRSLCPHVSPMGFLSVVLATVLWDLVAFSMRQSSELASNELKLTEANLNGETRPATLSGTRPTPLRPRGATGIGGTYYRGNDERSEKLFNGGDYRTAVLRLSLIDENDQPVATGQPLSGSQLFVRLEIERAANATPALFTESVLGEMLLTRRSGDSTERLDTDKPAKFKVLQEGERWAANYRLEDFHGQADVAINSIVYVYANANRTGETVQGTLHYGIVVALRIRERTLQENSELWLGPILFPNNFQYPTFGRVTLSEWLDTQPIPEIIGDNSTDPKLLGIPEHLKRGAKLPEK